MAKRKKVAVKAGRTSKPKKAPAKKAAAPVRHAPKPKREKQVRLLDDMPHDIVLDRICSTIHDALVDVNEGNNTVKQEKAKALARMAAKNAPIYRAHGVELIYVPGDAKIRCKLTDSDEGGEDPGDEIPGTDAGNDAGDVLDEGAKQ
jgi:hypothetical protein